MNRLPTSAKIKVAAITGHHAFDVPGFYTLFRSLPGIDAYPQSLDDYCASADQVREQYDVLVFYNFHQDTPGEKVEWWQGDQKTVLESLGESEQGILILHHGLLAYRKWQLWSDLVGIQERGFGYHPNETIAIHVEKADHPITEGLQDWEMIDETYTVDEPGEGCEILLTTDHPKSMRAIGWTRQYKQARVFCLVCGHDNQAFANAGFRATVARGIRWLARRL
ncbi:MAG: ThuA domain-containing protein [Anaerolineae bacterium]|nr:ThuA domain-containing protein [Anaerolineae bacterium]